MNLSINGPHYTEGAKVVAEMQKTTKTKEKQWQICHRTSVQDEEFKD